jgi:diacylglycerol kinase family enzyme
VHPPETTLLRAEEMAQRLFGDRASKMRMLVIVNPYATTVSDRLKNLVVYALESRYSVQAVDTDSPGHATQICREAAREGYDVVVAFGGDGTANEAANGLVGSETPLTCLPGGATNVFCRTLGIPRDVVDATEHLLRMADQFAPRRIDLGTVDHRHFTFSSGVGLDASVVRRVEAHPKLKRRLGEYYVTYASISTFNRRYLLRPPRVQVRVGAETVEGVTCIVQNSDPYTFFGDRPIRLAEGAGLDTGSLGVTVLKRATPLEVPTLLPRVFSGRSESVANSRQIKPFAGVAEVAVSTLDGRPFPLQMDGDYIGEFESVNYGVRPGALCVVS